MPNHNLAFPYRLVGGAALPIIDVFLLGPRGGTLVPCKVDSGASISVFRSDLLDQVGLRRDDGRRDYVTFGGNHGWGTIHSVQIAIREIRLVLDVFFADDLMFDYSLLGRRGVFDQFNAVAFSERVHSNRKIYFHRAHRD